MKILITGGAGFIGSNLAKYLLNKSHDLIIIDNLSTGKMSNIDSIKDSIHFFNSDIENFDFNRVDDVDAVFHLAAQASVPLSITNFEQSSSSNILSSIKVMNFCAQKDIPFIYASSSAIYGELDIGNDKSHEIDLLSPYAADKYCMEVYAEVCHKLFNLRSMGLRFFNVYGPDQDPHSPYSGVISIFIEKLINNNPITVYGGHQSRDFVYVDDVIECLYESIQVLKDSCIFETVNVLSGKSVTINNLVDIISKNLKIDPKIEYLPMPLGDPEKSDGTYNKMSYLFRKSVEDFTSIDKGLDKTILHIKHLTQESL
tara:strand:- start:5574 stop:6515 length:942 start_codon:yes stop_codon:yes gene_type:complete